MSCFWNTGALISILDRSQRRHQQFAEFFDSWTGQVVTSEAVLTESAHLLGRVAGGAVVGIDFVLVRRPSPLTGNKSLIDLATAGKYDKVLAAVKQMFDLRRVQP